jgi:hypothetical protein
MELSSRSLATAPDTTRLSMLLRTLFFYFSRRVNATDLTDQSGPRRCLTVQTLFFTAFCTRSFIPLPAFWIRDKIFALVKAAQVELLFWI